MQMWQVLNIQPGILCLTGGGGKTTLAHALAAQLPGSVVFCTTTKIYPSAQMPVLCEVDAPKLASALTRYHAVCIGTPTEEGKLAAPLLPFSRLRELADYVIVEADGSKGRPMKAHLPYEPVLPAEMDRCICLVGASGFGERLETAAHRPERFAELADAELCTPIDAQMTASVLRQEHSFDAVIVNQVETARQEAQAQLLAELLDDVPVYAGQVRDGQLRRLYGAFSSQNGA